MTNETFTPLNASRRARRWLPTGGALLAVLCLAFALGGCGSSDAAKAEDEANSEVAAETAEGSTEDGTDAATTTSNGQEFENGSLAWDGTSLTVEVGYDPTIGYEWTPMITGSGLELSGTQQNEAPGEAAENTWGDDVTNDSVYQVFTFTGKEAGTQTITLTYNGTGEPTEAAREVVVQVETGEGGEIVSASATSGTVGEALPTEATPDNITTDTITQPAPEESDPELFD